MTSSTSSSFRLLGIAISRYLIVVSMGYDCNGSRIKYETYFKLIIATGMRRDECGAARTTGDMKSRAKKRLTSPDNSAIMSRGSEMAYYHQRR